MKRQYAMENLGRQLMLVRWDTGIAVLVFPDEIVRESQGCLHAGDKANEA